MSLLTNRVVNLESKIGVIENKNVLLENTINTQASKISVLETQLSKLDSSNPKNWLRRIMPSVIDCEKTVYWTLFPEATNIFINSDIQYIGNQFGLWNRGKVDWKITFTATGQFFTVSSTQTAIFSYDGLKWTKTILI